MVKIGVFDSGVGGKSVVNAIKKEIPDLDIIYSDDPKNVPYGNKTPAQLLKLVVPKLNKLEAEGCEAIIIACNTVSTTIIEEIRSRLKVPVIAVEPMVRHASELTETKTIAVCATPTTLDSSRYKELLRLNAKHLTVLEPDCSDWAYMIENNRANYNSIKGRITEVCKEGADVIVLGCTHYHWIEEEIKEIAGKYEARVIQPEPIIIDELKEVLKRLA